VNFPIKILAANAALYGVGLMIPVFEGFASTWAWAPRLGFKPLDYGSR